MWRTNPKPHQLIKDAKISYSIVSLVFLKFSYQTYGNGLNQVPQRWGTPSNSKNTNCVSSIPQKFIDVLKITGHHFPRWV